MQIGPCYSPGKRPPLPSVSWGSIIVTSHLTHSSPYFCKMSLLLSEVLLAAEEIGDGKNLFIHSLTKLWFMPSLSQEVLGNTEKSVISSSYLASTRCQAPAGPWRHIHSFDTFFIKYLICAKYCLIYQGDLGKQNRPGPDHLGWPYNLSSKTRCFWEWERALLIITPGPQTQTRTAQPKWDVWPCCDLVFILQCSWRTVPVFWACFLPGSVKHCHHLL